MKKILIINGHPSERSLSGSIAENYLSGAVKAGHSASLIYLHTLNFDLILKGERAISSAIEPDIKHVQELISKADHLVFIYPIWWGTYPALFKGFIDRTFLSGYAYRHDKHSKKLIKLLKGKTARIIVTMDTPKWFYSLFYKNIGIRAVKQNLLHYCGITKVKTTSFSPVRKAGPKLHYKWLVQVKDYGTKGI